MQYVGWLTILPLDSSTDNPRQHAFLYCNSYGEIKRVITFVIWDLHMIFSSRAQLDCDDTLK